MNQNEFSDESESDTNNDNNEIQTETLKVKSWVWNGYAEKRKIENEKTMILEDRAVCCMPNCNWSILAKTSSGLTGAISKHLYKKHGVNPPNKFEATTILTQTITINNDRANKLLLKFIITGLLPFLIVENEAFIKYEISICVFFIYKIKTTFNF